MNPDLLPSRGPALTDGSNAANMSVCTTATTTINNNNNNKQQLLSQTGINEHPSGLNLNEYSVHEGGFEDLK